jgi:CarD family transcriptional regulator
MSGKTGLGNNVATSAPKSPRSAVKMTDKKTAAENQANLSGFKVGDHAVYPGYGVGKVVAVETKEIMGSKLEFYSVQILETGLKIMVPKAGMNQVGLRPIISAGDAQRVISILKVKDVKIDKQTWNRRSREYKEKINTGSVFEIAEVLRDLFLLKVDKELSFGERKMLDNARGLLMKELTLAVDKETLTSEEEVRQVFGL